MDHSEAINMKAVERYVLADLSASDVEEFERHFFDCPQCSEELRMLSVLQDNARAVFTEQSLSPATTSLPAIPRGAGWWNGLFRPWVAVPVAAMLAIAIFGGYEAGVRNQSNAPLAYSAYPLYAAARGDEKAITPPAGAQVFGLYMDRHWERDFPAYRSVIRDDPGGTERYSLRIPMPGEQIHVLIPAHALSAGRYVLVILGIDDAGHEAEVARYPFTLKFE